MGTTTNTKPRWSRIGEVAVDAGMLMVCDPCYAIGEEHDGRRSVLQAVCSGDWSTFLRDQVRTDVEHYALRHQINFLSGVSGAGVLAGTADGDGVFPVYALKTRDDSDRSLAILAITGDLDEVALSPAESLRALADTLDREFA